MRSKRSLVLVLVVLSVGERLIRQMHERPQHWRLESGTAEEERRFVESEKTLVLAGGTRIDQHDRPKAAQDKKSMERSANRVGGTKVAR